MQAVLDEGGNIVFIEQGPRQFINGEFYMTIDEDEIAEAAIAEDEIAEEAIAAATIAEEAIAEAAIATLEKAPKRKEITRWASQDVLCLIDSYRNHMSKFKDINYTNKQVWKIIAEECGGRPEDGPQYDVKFRNLKRTYKDIKQRNNTSGNGSSTWEFFQPMDELLGQRPDVTPVSSYESSEVAGVNRAKKNPPSADEQQYVSDDEEGTSASSQKNKTKRTPSWMREYKRITEKKMKAKEEYWAFKKEAHKEKMEALKELIEIRKKK